jgi:acyl-CoA synthetase (AMP-forming)/AMP-acid ligase II
LAEQPELGAHGPRIALRRGTTSLTFAELDDRAGGYASGLAAAGVGRGDRVLVLLRNSVRLFEMLIGAARVGAVTVPANTRLSDRELRGVTEDAGAVAVIGERELLERLPVGSGERLRLGVGPEYEAWLARHDPHPAAPGSSADLVLQIYTSGTSGRPKGVLLTDRNLAAKVTGVVERWGLDARSTSLLATPLFHVGALSWGWSGWPPARPPSSSTTPAPRPSPGTSSMTASPMRSSYRRCSGPWLARSGRCRVPSRRCGRWSTAVRRSATSNVEPRQRSSGPSSGRSTA